MYLNGIYINKQYIVVIVVFGGVVNTLLVKVIEGGLHHSQTSIFVLKVFKHFPSDLLLPLLEIEYGMKRHF